MMILHKNLTKRVIYIWCHIIFAVINAVLTVPPRTLHVNLLDHHQHITLKLIRTQGYLANHNLPVWYATRHDPAVLISNVMKELGSFSMYHDVDKSSAIVYFQKEGCVFGNIDTRFLINCLPLSLIGHDKYHIIGGPYVQRHDINNAFHDHLFHPDFSPYQTHMNNVELPTHKVQYIPNSPCSSSENPRTSDQTYQNADEYSARINRIHFDILYPEFLVYISYDVARQFATPEALVHYYLIHLNMVDMLFAKLMKDGVEIHINIAGLILESEPNVFPYMFYIEQPLPWHILDGLQTIMSFSSYFKTLGQSFTEDSFDFYILSTNYDIWHSGAVVDGLGQMDFQNFQMRRALASDIGIYNSPGMLVNHRLNHRDFATYAHEIAHMMRVGHDPAEVGYNCFNTQCYAILQPTASFCRNCIVWSIPSRISLRAYASTDLDRCFLLNSPRSLHPIGIPIQTIDPHRQCQCYGYESYWKPSENIDFVRECRSMFMCTMMDQPIPNAIPPPLDGTPCGLNQVCWNKECVPLTP